MEKLPLVLWLCLWPLALAILQSTKIFESVNLKKFLFAAWLAAWVIVGCNLSK